MKKGEKRKQDLIRIAYRLFTARGYEHTSVDEIIAEAGIAKGTYYYYFESKEQMLEDVVGMMLQAEAGERAAEEIFRSIGRHLGHISREICWLLSPETEERFLFGRFVRHPRCFALIREGCGEVLPSLRLTAADGELARSDLMRQLSARGEGMVARFGQAVGALYYGIEEET